MTSQTNLYVGNLPTYFDDALLRQTFEVFGAIVSHKAIIDVSTGQCKGFGFVQFADPASAAVAVNTMNGHPIDDKLLLVKLADHDAGAAKATLNAPIWQGLQAAAVPTQPSDNIFVGGIPLEWTQAELNSMFASCGTILSSIVLVDKPTGRSKGIGLVRFSDTAAATRAVQNWNGSAIQGTGRTLEVKFAERPEEKGVRKAVKQVIQQLRFSPYVKPGMPGGGPGAALGVPNGPINVPRRTDIAPEEGANLHIFGLDFNITDLNLFEAFSPYGAIKSVKVIVDPATRQPKGYGFVQFFSAQDAANAMTVLNGTQVGTRTWNISLHQKKA